MSDNTEGLSAVLVQLDRIAKAPMTATERELRAKSVLGGSVDVESLAAATAREDLHWSVEKAAEHGVPTHTWVRATEVVGLPASSSLAELLERMHRADAAAEMLKAGYAAGIDPLGARNWRARG
jgi:hypothetical protein